MKSISNIGIVLVTLLSIAIISIFLFLSTLVIYFCYETPCESASTNDLEFTSFAGYSWVKFSKWMPYSCVETIDSWFFQLKPLQAEENRHFQYSVTEIRFEAFSTNKNIWVQLAQDEPMQQFRKISLDQYAIELNAPASILISEEIKITLKITITDLDSNRKKEEEVTFLHEIKRTKKYRNYILEYISGV